MKSERRHELTTNELADWIARLPDWFSQNRGTVIIVAAVIAALIAYTIFYYGFYNRGGQKQQPQITRLMEQLGANRVLVLEGKQKGLGISNSFFTIADSLQTAARQTKNPTLSAMAMIKRAEALRAELHYRSSPAEPDIRKAQLLKAEGIYKKALEKAKAGGNPTVSAMAQYGVGLCLEGMGQFTEAADIYTKIAKSPTYDGTLYKKRAQMRLEILPQIQKKVYLLPPSPAKASNNIHKATPVPVTAVPVKKNTANTSANANTVK